MNSARMTMKAGDMKPDANVMRRSNARMMNPSIKSRPSFFFFPKNPRPKKTMAMRRVDDVLDKHISQFTDKLRSELWLMFNKGFFNIPSDQRRNMVVNIRFGYLPIIVTRDGVFEQTDLDVVKHAHWVLSQIPSPEHGVVLSTLNAEVGENSPIEDLPKIEESNSPTARYLSRTQQVDNYASVA